MRASRIAVGWIAACVLAAPLACNAILGITDVTAAHDAGGGEDNITDPPNEDQFAPPDPDSDILDSGILEAGPNDLQVGLMNTSTCARKQDGTVFCWGNDTLGQLGDGLDPDGAPPMVPSPSKVITITDALSLAGGYDHVCALLSDRTVSCWGYNHYGQLGISNADNTSSHPVAVAGLRDVAMLASGSVFSCALKIDGTAACWGGNYAGQLGDGTKTDTSNPVAVFQLIDATSIGAGDSHACALRKDKTVVCWGSNTEGQLANATIAESLTPVPVPVTDVAAIAVGGTFSCALLSGGGVECWGSDVHGELGNGATNATSNPAPVAVLSLGDAIQIAAGYDHACALRQNGQIVCWGNNFNGELGDGPSDPEAGTDMPTPVPVQTLTNALHVVTNGNHTCATTRDEHLFCWGEGAAGQIGDGMAVDRSTPVAVLGF